MTREKAASEEIGYESHEPDIHQLAEWYRNSCGLQFVHAVFHNPTDPNTGFVDLIPQDWADS